MSTWAFQREFKKHGESRVSSRNHRCAPEPVETFTWLLSPNQIQLNRFTFSPSGDPKYPRQLIKLDRIEEAEEQ